MIQLYNSCLQKRLAFKIVSPLKEPLFLPPMLKGAEKPCENQEEKVLRCRFTLCLKYQVTSNSDSSQNAILSFGPHRGAMLYNGQLYI